MRDEHFLNIAKIISICNPDGNICVGAVIVKDGNIISIGYRKTIILHKNPFKDVTIHAEHMAIMTAGELAVGSTIYVTLEPCTKRSCASEFDVNKCCCDFIIDAGISKVVYLEKDIKFGGGGHEYLLNNGINVVQYA